MSKNLVLIGKNISHSMSPNFYNEYFSKNNLDFKYSLCEIDDLKLFIDNLQANDIFAFNITMPYKTEIMKYINNPSEICNQANSSNLVIVQNNNLYGYNTDGIGFYNSLIANHIELKNKNITIIGFGGAGKSINACSKLYGIKNTYIIDHNVSRKLFANDAKTYNEIINILLNSDIIVNASNTGFGNDNNLPLPKNIIDDLCKNKTDFCFVDIIYNPKETEFLKLIRSHNVTFAFNGEQMLHHQFLENIKIIAKYF